MSEKTCPHCNFKYISVPKDFCVNCGYGFDYIRNYMKYSVSDLKRIPSLISIRQTLCSIPEKDSRTKGMHAYFTLTNKGLIISIYEKFENGIFVKKKWKFKENPKIFVPFEDILSIEQATFKGKPAGFFHYVTKNNGVIPLGFYADGSIKSGNLDLEMKKLIEVFRK